jgi:hypothetical protein
VAAEAQFIGVQGQQIFVGRGVRIVAAGALAGFQGRVHRSTFNCLLKRHMTFQAKFAFGAGFEFELAGRINSGNQYKGSDDAK